MTPDLLQGDCFEVLQTLEPNSVDSCVTDPPYGFGDGKAAGFMGKQWDRDVPSADLWREVYRVLKPGAHLLSFFGTRTYHRGVAAVEYAGPPGVFNFPFVLLTLERTWTLTGHDVNGEEIWEGVGVPGSSHGIVHLPTKVSTRRTWYRADEEVR